VSTGAGHRAHAALGCGHGRIELAVDDGDSATVEMNPIFSLITVAAALSLDECTAELVQGLQVDVLLCLLRSVYTSCDAVRALRAVAARDGREDRDAIVRALADKLAPVSVDALLDVLKDAPSLGGVDAFSRLVVSHIVAAPRCGSARNRPGPSGQVRPRGARGSERRAGPQGCAHRLRNRVALSLR
jgi:hypothetical protein